MVRGWKGMTLSVSSIPLFHVRKFVKVRRRRVSNEELRHESCGREPNPELVDEQSIKKLETEDVELTKKGKRWKKKWDEWTRRRLSCD